MAQEAAKPQTPSLPLAPKVIGHVGLWASVAGCLACLVLLALGARGGEDSGAYVLAGLLFALVAGLGVLGFWDFLHLQDWTVATVVPLGMKLLGHVGRVLGSMGAAAFLALALLTITSPAKVPPRPMKKVGDAWEYVDAKDSAANAPRPGLAATWVVAFFASLLVRTVGSSVTEARRWARFGGLIVFGAAVALFTVLLILNLTTWKFGAATAPLALFDAVSALAFLFLLVYFNLPETVAAFEAQGL